jgi:hypothetical protein
MFHNYKRQTHRIVEKDHRVAVVAILASILREVLMVALNVIIVKKNSSSNII